MRNLRRGVLAISMALLLQGAFAQKERNPEEMARKQTTKMGEHVDGLSANQMEQLEALNLKYVQKRRALFEDKKEQRSEMREAMKAMHKEKKSELGKVLNAEQLKQLDAYHKAQREAGKEKRHARKPVPVDQK